MSANAVILFAHGAKSPEWEKPMRTLAEELAKELAPAAVTLAFLQFGDPKLPEAIDEQVREGAVRIIILPYFLAAGGHLLRDLPRMIEQAKQRHPGIEFHAAHPLGEDPEVVAGLKRACLTFVRSVIP